MQQFGFRGFNVLPDVVKNLLILNGLFFLATIVLESSFGIELTGKLALYYYDSDKFKPYQFISHLFMHGSFWHLFSNMFALWMFGSALENFWGGKKLFIYYIATGLGAAALHTGVMTYHIYGIDSFIQNYINAPSIESFNEFIKDYVPEHYTASFMSLLNNWMDNPSSTHYLENSIYMMNQFLDVEKNIPTVGASGAVFGVLLAFGMTFPNQIIYMNFFFPIKAKYFVLLYGLFELYTGLQNYKGDNIAHFAHLGGMIFGYFLIRYWRNQKTSFF